MNNQYYNELFERLLEGKLSPKETSQLLEWLNRDENAGEAASLISSRLTRGVTEEEITPEIRNALQARLPLVFHAAKQKERGRLRLLHQSWVKYAAAAVLIIAVTFSLRSMLQEKRVNTTTSTEQPITTTTDIGPGSQGAILTLADGRKVVLDSLGNGTISLQKGAQVLLKDGKLVYDPVAADDAHVVYNEISTPKGRQFQLILPDGTKVWLNAASSLKYPTHFNGNERRVEIKGEAYFEVAGIRLAAAHGGGKMPFIVALPGGAAVKVLGTHFNINAYDDEPAIKTTLLEGAVQVSSMANGEWSMLKPGQQAVIKANSSLAINNSPNIEKVMAWKNGVFNFEEATLQEVMHQLERWYDIEVTYETGIPKLEFVGKMGRDLSLNSVLRGLELSKVHFRLEGRKLVVLP